MEMNMLGLIAAGAAFVSIWIGHVAVRRIEYAARAIWIPTAAAIALGLITVLGSLVTDNVGLSTILGIAGITILFDAFEFSRQHNRVRKGHAPANPANPRHVKILAAYPSATVLDPLQREPVAAHRLPDVER